MHSFEFIPPREYMSVALRLRSTDDFSRQGQLLLDEQVKKIEASGVPVAGTQLRMGSPVDQILYMAEEIGAGLIVVGRRGLGGVKRLLLGSVSEGVIHNSSCPVLVLRSADGAWPPSHVLMAEDTSEDARQAAELASSIGGLFRASGSLVQVYPRLLKAPGGYSALEAGIVERVLQGAEENLREHAESLEKRLGSRPEVELTVDEGSTGVDAIALTLIDKAKEIGESTLISVGSRGLGRISRVRVGSVSTKVVRAAYGPVLVHPARRDA